MKKRYLKCPAPHLRNRSGQEQRTSGSCGAMQPVLIAQHPLWIAQHPLWIAQHPFEGGKKDLKCVAPEHSTWFRAAHQRVMWCDALYKCVAPEHTA
jgi:hypothetical protein